MTPVNLKCVQQQNITIDRGVLHIMPIVTSTMQICLVKRGGYFPEKPRDWKNRKFQHKELAGNSRLRELRPLGGTQDASFYKSVGKRHRIKFLESRKLISYTITSQPIYSSW
jgi:hypothetical protein